MLFRPCDLSLKTALVVSWLKAHGQQIAQKPGFRQVKRQAGLLQLGQDQLSIDLLATTDCQSC